MYRFQKDHQFSLTDFNQPMGMKLNPENRWIKKAETIPGGDIEIKYATIFPSKTGMPAKPLRMALGSLLLQKHRNLLRAYIYGHVLCFSKTYYYETIVYLVGKI